MADIEVGTRVKWTEEEYTKGETIEGTVVNIYEDFAFPYEIQWDTNKITQDSGLYLHDDAEFEVIQ